MALVIGFVSGLIANGVAVALGRRLRLLDKPHGIKIHANPVPFTGGLAYMLVLTLWAALVPIPVPFAAAALAIWAVGFADDVWGLEPARKLFLLFAALVLALPALETDLIIKLTAAVMGVVLINMFNVLDGLDGLAGGTAFFALLPTAVADPGALELAALTAGFAASFLMWNVYPARIFLGNQGSLVLGYVIWFISVSAVLQQPAAPTILGAALLWTVPIANAAFVIVRRTYERRPILIGDRSHLYDVLYRRLGLRTTVVIFWTTSALAGIVAAIAHP